MLIFHIRSISENRLMKKIGQIRKSELLLAIKTLNDILNY